MKKFTLAAGAALTLAACSGGLGADEIGMCDGIGWMHGPDEETLVIDSIDTFGLIGVEDGTRFAAREFVALHEAEGWSPALLSKMDRTRALDGTVEHTEDNAEVSWSYHPDTGIYIVIEYTGPSNVKSCDDIEEGS